MSSSKIKPGISFANYLEGKSCITKKDIEVEKSFSKKIDNNRSRICFHQSNSDLIHEMIITFHKNSYVQPHKHLNKTESYLVINGEIDLIFFHDDGTIKERVSLGEYNSNNPFYLRSISDEWHTIIIKSQFATILEITNGPFVANDCVFAEWAPEPSNTAGIFTFIKSLNK